MRMRHLAFALFDAPFSASPTCLTSQPSPPEDDAFFPASILGAAVSGSHQAATSFLCQLARFSVLTLGGLALSMLGVGGSLFAAAQTPAALDNRQSYAHSSLAFSLDRSTGSHVRRFVTEEGEFHIALSRRSVSFEPLKSIAGIQSGVTPSRVSIEFPGAREDARMVGLDEISSGYSIFKSQDPHQWQFHVPLYRQISYPNLYRGIDLTFHENQQRLEYDFSVHEGVDPNLIHLRMNGARRVNIDTSGDLILEMGDGSIRFRKPVVYQGSGSERKVIEAHYTLTSSGQRGQALIGFALGDYDRNKLLVIDPVLDFSHVPGDGSDSVSGVAADQFGASYVVSGNGLGSFTVREFGADGSLQRTAVVAMTQDTALIQSTAIAVSSSGLVYVTGFAEPGLPTTSNAVQESNGGGTKAFLAVLEPKDGSFDLKYSSYVGGPGVSRASGLAVDDTGTAYIAGERSNEQVEPIAGGFRTAGGNAAAPVGFVVKVNPFNGGETSLIYSKLLSNGVLAIAADGAGNVYVLQQAVRGLKATPGAFGYDKPLQNGEGILVTKVDSSSGRVVYSANLGPGHGSGIAVDRSGAVYVTGSSAPNGPPASAGAYRSDSHGGFVLKLNAAGSGIEYLTYLGGTGDVSPESIAIRRSCVSDCSVYVTGITSASDFPSISPVQSVPGALPAVFVVELTANATGVKYSTLLGDQTLPARIASRGDGQSAYVARPAIAVDGRGDAHIAGNLTANPADSSVDLPMVILDPGSSAFLAKISGEKQSRLAALPGSIDFGNASINGLAASAEFTLRNTGSDDVQLEPFEVIPSNEFSLANQCGALLTAGASCVVAVRFSPLASGVRSGTILIQAQGDDTPLTLPVAGIGVASAGSGSAGSSTPLVQPLTTPTGSPTAALSPASLSFGNQMVGTAPTTLSSTLTNTGSASVSISSVTIGGTNASQYSFSVPAPKSVCSSTLKLAVGASCTISVQWTPALGQSSAAVTIADNAGTGSQTLPLSGNGTGYAVPFVEALKPALALPGGSAFTFNLNGTELAPGATARWNGTSLTTSVLSSTQATATVPASLIATGGSGIITLTNPKPTAVISNQKPFLVASSIPTLGFSATPFPSLAVNQPSAILGVDVNGDFKPDLVVLDALDGNAQVFVNAGTGRLTLKSSPAVASNPIAVAAGDFNEDGKLDLAVLSGNGTVTILTGDGQGNYPTSTSFLSGSAGQSIVAGDFNGDGHLDLAVLNPSNDAVSLFLGNGANGFTQVSSTPVGVSPYGLIATDFNQDGILDLAVGNGDGTVTVLLGNGSGGFATAPAVATGQAAAAIVTGDFNEDGIPDLAVGGSNGAVTILSGVGDGTFTNPSSFNSGSSLSSMVVGDFNADGHQDLIVASSGSNQAAVFLGTGKATYNAGPVLTTVSGPTSLAALDLNVDGYLDLAIGSSSANNVQLQFQEPVATVSQTLLAFGQELINVASQPLAVTIANSGSLPLTLSSISISPASGTGAADLTQTNTCGTLPVKISPTGSCTVNVVFTPSKLANESALLVFTDTSGGTSTTQKVSLTGTGVTALSSQIAFTAPPSVFGTAAQVVATVTAPTATPTGSLTLTVGSNSPITQTLVNGSTTFNVTGLSAGNNSFVLNYPAQGSFAASSTTGALSVSPSVPVLQWAQPAPIPTALPLGSMQLNATASTPGTFTYQPPAGTTLGIGNNQVLKATFTPTDSVDFTSASISTTINVTANPASQISFTAPASVSGTAAQVTATVTGSSGTPAGSLTLTVGSNPPITQTLVNGSATFNVTGLPVGSNSFVLNYPAQGIYAASSATGTLLVSTNISQIVFTASPSMFGTTAQVAATMVASTATPTGSLTLTVGSNPPITQTLVNGSTTFNVTGLPVGNNSFVLNYPAQGTFAASSATGTLSVSTNVPQIAFTAPATVFGSSAQVAATVTGSIGTPAGSLTLTVGSNAPLTQMLANGAATFNVAGLPAGNNSFVLNYPAQGSFAASSATGTLSVSQSVPVLQWAQPAPIPTAVPLGSKQLNATASTPGAFTYQPPAGTILGIGNNQAINATFTPTDSVDYTPASISTTINVTANPVPFVNPILASSITPAAAAAGFTLNLNGTGFVPTTAVKFNGKTLTTAVNGSTSLSATVPANFIESATTLLVKVFNPEHTKGGLAQTVFLPVTNPTSGTFLASSQSSSLSSVNTPGQMTFGQFDSSGYEDLAVLDSADGTVRLYYGTANGTYFYASSVPVGAKPISIAMGDFNEDGKTDWAVADANGNITILTGNGTGTFTPLPGFSSGSAAQFVAVADLNLDGHADLAVINPATNTVEVFWGTGTGSFTLGTQFSTGQGPTSLVIADFNGDGYPDIAVSNSDGTISVYLGNSSGTYTAAASPSTGSSATAIATGDFNEDGIPDLAITGSNGNMTILLGVGDGTFTAAPAITLSAGTQSIGVGDFNGDGHLDLAVANQNASSLTILLGSGNGDFAAQPTIATTGAPTALSVVDMNYDGREDIALSSTNANAIYTYFQAPNAALSTSSVSFGTPLEGVASNPQSVTVSNTGSAPLTISAIAITAGQNANSADFSQTNTCGALPATVLPGASCSVNVVLDASTTLPENAIMVITDNSGLISSSTQAVSLADNGAIGHPTQATVTPGPSIVFGGATTATVSITSQYGTPPGFVTLTVDSFAPISQALTNGSAVFPLTGLTAGVHQLVALYPTQSGGFQTSTGTSTITVTKASPAVNWPSPSAIVAGTPLSSAQLNATATVAGSYVYSPPAGTILPAGNNQSLSVSFLPADTNDYNTGSAATSINVLSSSTAVYVAPSSLNFNSQIQGIASAVQNAYLLNKGTTPITLKSLSIGGSSYAIYSTFSLTSGTNVCAKSEVIAAGSSCTLGVSFKPTALGAFSATLSVSYVIGTGTAQTTLAVPLSGIGAANPVPLVQPIIPSAVAPATAQNGFTLLIPGAGFDASSVVSMNGKALTTQLVTNSAGVTALQATVPSGLVTAESSGMITVANAKPTGLVSNNLGSVAFTNPLNTSNFLLGPFSATSVNTPTTVLAIDVNGDHYPDVVVLDTKDNEVLTYTNANSGHVTLASTINITAGNITGVAAGDFNEDGKLDLAVATSNGEVTILLGNGSGSFTAQTPFSAGSSAQGIAAADLNSDGHWDLVVTNPIAGTATVLLGLGTGSFTSAATLTAGVSPYGVAIADFNLDGIPDIAVGNADGSISVFLAGASGVYLPASTPDTGAPAIAIVSGDFNEDGIPDLAVLNTDNTVTLLTGTGTGVFNIAAQAAVGNSPLSMSVGDLNGDGHLDLLVANSADNTVSILYGTGAGSFSPQTVAPVAPGPLSVSAADMNNDGRVDFVVSSATNNAFSVLMQTPLTAFSVSSLSFGSEVYGVTTASQTFTVSNNGSGPLFVSSFGVHSGYDSPDFGMTTNCGTAPFTLNPQTSCTVTISFTPAKIGNESAMFAMVDNSGNVGGTPHYVTFTGMGLAVPTTITMSAPSTATYGSTVTVNTSMTSATGVLPHGLLTLTVGNYAPLTQRLLTDGTAAFQVTGLPVGTYQLVANWAAQFQFATTQVVGTLTVQQATPTINWPAPASITQGTPLTSAQLNASASVSGTFVYSPPASTVLSAGNNQQLNVTFTPTDTANYSSATAANTISVLPAPSTLVITESSLSFGSLAMGASSAPQTSTLINSGTTPVAIGGIAISGTNSSFFQFVSPAPGASCLNLGGSLAPGASCTLDVSFIPAATGSLSASIVVSDNAGSGSQTISLGGTGNYNPTPFIERISPTAVSPSSASGGFALNVEGAGFAPGASLLINGQTVPATVQNSTHLKALVPAGSIATTSTPILYIVNPGSTGDLVSNPIPLPITNPTSNVVIGTGPFPPTPIHTPQEMTVADFNQDGIPDVAVADYQDGTVQVYLGAASGTLTLQSTLNVGVTPASLCFGDFNEDGHLDLAVLSSDGSFSIWFGDGAGNFTAGPTISATPFGNHIATADFNGDGHLDIAVVDSVQQIVVILTGTGTGSFNYAATLNTGVGPYSLAVADFNLDGILDLAVGDADGTVGIFLGNGDGTFVQATSFDTGAPASDLTAGDFNEDGIPDLAIANINLTGVGTNGSVSIWSGAGNGLFTFASQTAAGHNPSAIVPGDFNGDGHLDLAVANQSSNNIQILMGSGASSFISSGPLQSGNGPTALGVGDFNSDGRLDLVALDADSNSIGILFQQPQATLSVSGLTFPTQPIGTSSAPQSFTITNTGSATAPLSVSSINVTPAFNTGANDFQESNFCQASLPPGGTCTVNVVFSPSYVATENATLTVTDNSMGVPNTQTVALSGVAPLPTGVLATSQINPTAPTMTVPPSFMGMSFDWNTAESWFGSTTSGADPIIQQLLSNLMAYSTAPFQIRISGDSYDMTGTLNSTTVVPFAQLAQNMNVHYILGLNLDLDSLSLTQSQASTYAAAVPNNAIDAFEIGNEPDNYVSNGARGNNYGIQPYLTERSTFMQGVEAAVPNLQRFADPALASSGWLSGIEAGLLSGTLPGNIVTQHSYLTCYNAKTPFPLDQLLQYYATYSAPRLWGTFATVAHQAGQAFRIGELNSVCQGGQPGLSNNFTSALWSIDTMFAFLSSGVDGVNWHTSAGTYYNAFNLTVATKSGKNTYTLGGVNPLYYGMLLFAQATGNGARMLPISNLTNANLDIWATVDNNGTVHVVVINKDENQTGSVQISVPGYNSAVALPLTASSYTATSGVHFAGQTFDGSTNGTIQGTQVTQTITSSNGVFSVSVPTTSAVLLNLTQ